MSRARACQLEQLIVCVEKSTFTLDESPTRAPLEGAALRLAAPVHEPATVSESPRFAARLATLRSCAIVSEQTSILRLFRSSLARRCRTQKATATRRTLEHLCRRVGLAFAGGSGALSGATAAADAALSRGLRRDRTALLSLPDEAGLVQPGSPGIVAMGRGG